MKSQHGLKGILGNMLNHSISEEVEKPNRDTKGNYI